MKDRTINPYTILSILALLAMTCSGCKSSQMGQPKLHIPSPAQAVSWTNRFASNNTITRLKFDTNSPISSHIQIASDADVAEEFGQIFADCFFVGEVAIENTNNTLSFLAYSSSLQVNITYYVAEKDWQTVRTNMLERFGKEYILSSRRPSTYSDILAIFEHQRQSNGRQQFINWLQSAGEAAAGAAIFVGGPLYPKAVSFATGIVTPELQKRLLWDILLHAKNLESRSLKEVEEIPPCSSIHRVVFFPKRPIPGILDGYPVYISSFKPWQPVAISGSFIDKKGTAASASLVSVSPSNAEE